MTVSPKSRGHLLWLVLGTVALAMAMAALLVYELAQSKAIEARSALGADSVTALVYQFEREFLRLRQSLDLAVHSGEPIQTDPITLRYDIFYSRLTLVRESPTVSALMERPDFGKTVDQVGTLGADLEKVLASPHPNLAQLRAIRDRFEALGPEVQALSQAADSDVARTVELQKNTMRDQNTQIVRLTIAQLVLLLIVASGLYARHRRQEQERLALEQLTQELQEARVLAEAANRGKSQFLTNMSHELRTPFNGLLGMLQLLQGTAVSAEQTDYLQTAQTSAKRLLALLNDVLDVSSLDSGDLVLKPAPLHLPTFLQEALAVIAPQAQEKQLALHWNVQPLTDLPSHWLVADADRLQQIFTNLMVNAIKFTPSGAVSVEVSAQSLPEQRVKLVLAVKDTGIGMDSASQAQLFQRFYQVDASATRRYGGTGLGLEISQALANMMGGQIAVESALGAGSCFTATLVLPWTLSPESSRPVIANDLPQSEGPPPMRVLVAEDHPINQKLIGAFLDRLACRVTMVEDGQRAVEAVSQGVFDLVLMDVNMPVMDGLTAIRQIRAMPNLRAQTPIAVVTADLMNSASDNAMAAGANDFLGKPLHYAQVEALILKYRKNTA